MHSPRPWTLLLIAGSLVSLLPVDAAARAKTDLIFLSNGDRMTGEIKQLSHGILQLSTDAVGTLSIEWEDVDSLVSVYRFRVEDGTADKRFGMIRLTRDGMLRVIEDGQSHEIPQLNVANITPLEATFWDRIDGSVSLGLSYTKSNQLGQLSSDFNARYRTPLRVVELDFSSLTTAQEDRETQRREDLTLSYARLFEGPLFAVAATSAQSNDELGLDLRLLLTTGIGAKLVQTLHNELRAAVGLSVNREWSHNSADAYNLEAALSAQHSIYSYDFPKTNISVGGGLFPNLTSWGRVRAELDISASREIVKDFTAFLSFYDSFDSDPPDPTAAKNDYGLVMTFGWTF